MEGAHFAGEAVAPELAGGLRFAAGKAGIEGHCARRGGGKGGSTVLDRAQARRPKHCIYGVY